MCYNSQVDSRALLFNCEQVFVLEGLQLLQAANLTASYGVFSTVAPCQALLDIITSTPTPTSGLGNFTERPSEQLLRDCSTSSAVYLLNGDTLARALSAPTPMLKVGDYPSSL